MNALVGLFVLSLLGGQGQFASHQGDTPSRAAGGELRVKLEDASERQRGISTWVDLRSKGSPAAPHLQRGAGCI